MSARARRALIVIGLVSATVAVRLPFLLLGDRFFSSDEAVEGLMARHVLQGEFPVFFWGQAYKGVPEVYAAALVFRAAGSSVLALQSVTLAIFAVFVGLQFLFMRETFSTPIALLASLFVIVAPPVLVYWSLVGLAEISITLLAGTVLLYAAWRWRATGSTTALAWLAFACGFALWVQQYVLYYVAALVLTRWTDDPAWRRSMLELARGRGLSKPVALAVAGLLGVAGLYTLLGLHAFFTGGFAGTIAGVTVRTNHPQKMWGISAVIFIAAVVSAWWLRELRRDRARLLRHTAVGAGAFLLGFGPSIVGRLRGGGVRSALHEAGAVEMLRMLRQTGVDLAPPLFGFRGPLTEPLYVPVAWAAVIAVAAILSYGAVVHPGHARHTRFFHIYPIAVIAIFLLSGSLVDVQSVRYLIPLYAALPLIYAVGVSQVSKWNRAGGALLATALVGLFALQQVRWYRTLTGDRGTARIIGCLRDEGVQYAWADYWTSYEATFVVAEEIIVAPNDTDRYPPYTALVRAHPDAPTIVRPVSAGASCADILRRP